MDTNLLKYLAFVRTAECGSFTKAAEMLNYSQSGISRMIQDLEKEYGLTLLERGRAGVRLTSDGTKMLPFARELCSRYDQFRMQAQALTGLESGLIRIGTFSSAATHWLPGMIQAFQRDFPKIEYELLLGDYTEIEEWIVEGRVDCGFLHLPTARDDLETIFLEQDPLLAVFPESHPLAALEKIPLSAICAEPFLLLEKGGQNEISAIFKRAGLWPDVRLTTWDDYAIMSMIESGLGISILPKLILRRIPYRVIAKELEVPAYRSLGIAFRSKKSASLAVKHFLSYLPYRNPLPEDGFPESYAFSEWQEKK